MTRGRSVPRFGESTDVTEKVPVSAHDNRRRAVPFRRAPLAPLTTC